jgi:hypothetical protein
MGIRLFSPELLHKICGVYPGHNRGKEAEHIVRKLKKDRSYHPKENKNISVFSLKIIFFAVLHTPLASTTSIADTNLSL